MTPSVIQPLIRFKGNPILTPQMVNRAWKDPRHQVITVHNAGVTEFKGQVLLLFRSHLRNGISVLGLAKSRNGQDDWQLDKGPVLIPCTSEDSFAVGVDINMLIENEQGGLEDPRITQIGDTYYITYSAYHAVQAHRVRVSLMTTQDFATFTRFGPLLETDMRNVVLFPEPIKGRFYGLFRPNDATPGHTGGKFKQIKIGSTVNIEEGNWRITDAPIIAQAGGPSSFSDKIGPGAPPLKTAYGWIHIFHGVRSTMDGNPYVLGVALHDLEDPTQVKVANFPILFPTRADCRLPEEAYVHVPQVVFCCGALRRPNGEIWVYYGGNDTVMNLAITHERELAQLCNEFSQEPTTGRPEYELR